jgi:hypothetical protein
LRTRRKRNIKNLSKNSRYIKENKGNAELAYQFLQVVYQTSRTIPLSKVAVGVTALPVEAQR